VGNTPGSVGGVVWLQRLVVQSMECVRNKSSSYLVHVKPRKIEHHWGTLGPHIRFFEAMPLIFPKIV